MKNFKGSPIDSVVITGRFGRPLEVSSFGADEAQHDVIQEIIKDRCRVLFKLLNPYFPVPLTRDVVGEIGRHLYQMGKHGDLDILFCPSEEPSVFTVVSYCNPTEDLMLLMFEKLLAKFSRRHVWTFTGTTRFGLALRGDYLDIAQNVARFCPPSLLGNSTTGP